jgi:hypothetical protein
VILRRRRCGGKLCELKLIRRSFGFFVQSMSLGCDTMETPFRPRDLKVSCHVVTLRSFTTS